MENNDKEQLRNTFPSNSKISKREPQLRSEKPEERKIKKAIKGCVKIQKRSLGKKLADTFLEDSTKTVGSYVFHDVLIPAAKSMICDMIGWGGFAEILLFGDKRGGGRGRSGSSYNTGTRTPYGAYYRSSERDREPKDSRRDISRNARARHDFDEVIFETRGEAEQVLSLLVDQIIEYQQATVADFYGFVGITSNYTDDKYGWTDLRDASVSRVRNGYLINFPRTQPLD